MRSRIARFAMRRRAIAVGALILVFVMAGTALAVGPGSTFKLGVINSISGYVTTLTGSNNGAMLAIKNTNTNSGSKGLSINVPAGKPPIVVNGTAGKATGLNADKVDGKNASAFLPVGGKALDAFHADAADTSTNAGNANTVGGYAANSLARIARAGASVAVAGGTATNVISTTITPGAASGFLEINGGVAIYAHSATALNFYSVQAYVDGVAVGQTMFVSTRAAFDIATVPVTTAAAVTTAASKTVTIRVHQYSGAASNHHVYANLTVSYVPFGSTGSPTVLGAGALQQGASHVPGVDE
jgi:hypothetical protein